MYKLTTSNNSYVNSNSNSYGYNVIGGKKYWSIVVKIIYWYGCFLLFVYLSEIFKFLFKDIIKLKTTKNH